MRWSYPLQWRVTGLRPGIRGFGRPGGQGGDRLRHGSHPSVRWARRRYAQFSASVHGRSVADGVDCLSVPGARPPTPLESPGPQVSHQLLPDLRDGGSGSRPGAGAPRPQLPSRPPRPVGPAPHHQIRGLAITPPVPATGRTALRRQAAQVDRAAQRTGRRLETFSGRRFVLPSPATTDQQPLVNDPRRRELRVCDLPLLGWSRRQSPARPTAPAPGEGVLHAPVPRYPTCRPFGAARSQATNSTFYLLTRSSVAGAAPGVGVASAAPRGITQGQRMLTVFPRWVG